MRTAALLTITLLSSVSALGCDLAEDAFALDADRASLLTHVSRAEYPVGTPYGPCDIEDSDQPSWWGCDGMLGEGLACARPVSVDGLDLSICVPQTWDALIGPQCGSEDPLYPVPDFGLGVRIEGSAYCVPDCVDDSDCAEGQACAPASGFCAWINE